MMDFFPYSIKIIIFLIFEFSAVRQCSAKRIHFSAVGVEETSTQRVLLASIKSPSELACSQKCFHHDKCKYKKYNAVTQICDLLQSFVAKDVNENALLTKKESFSDKDALFCNAISNKSCGEKCSHLENSQISGKKHMCDCRGQGIYKSCNTALSNNCFQQGVYRIFPEGLTNSIDIECTRDKEGRSFAVLHHNSENATLVRGYEAAGSYRHNFNYELDMGIIISLVNRSSYCQQHINAQCYHVIITNQCWIRGRDGQKLTFWGGGPSDGIGCACGITNSCSTVTRKCNCDANDAVWRSDQGYVQKKDVLPITGINIGDTGDPALKEKFIYTVGPLLCIF